MDLCNTVQRTAQLMQNNKTNKNSTFCTEPNGFETLFILTQQPYLLANSFQRRLADCSKSSSWRLKLGTR